MDHLNQGTILVVDDEPSVLGFVSGLLEEHGYHVIACGNAEDGVAKFSETHIDVVITDIKMPMTSGIELLDKVNSINPDTPVILMTGHADIAVAIDAIKRRAFDLILKPYTADKIIYPVQRAMKYSRLIYLEKDYRTLLEEFNRELETLVSERTMGLMTLTVADRVRNPAATIGQLCRRILEKETLSPGARSGVENILEEAGRLEKIVSDFHGVFKNRQSRFTYEDLNEIVKNSISVAQKEADIKGVTLVESLFDQPLRINTQKHLLCIAISQLIRNAIEATSGDGNIIIATSGKMDRVILTVTDTGHGIPAEDTGRIFDPFFTTRDRRYGMGLSLVKQIVEEHLGEITVESSPEKGTQFTVVFPVRWLEKALNLP